MAKELPYFRFTAQEWQNGDITLEDMDIQGLFVNTCCYYWLSDCSLTLAKLKQRLNTWRSSLEILLKNGHIKHNEDTDFIEIKFLDEQFDLLSEKRKKRQKAGKIGGLKKSSNAKAKRKQKSSYKDKDKDKDKDKILYIVDRLNQITNQNYKASGKKTQTLIKARISDGFTIKDFETVIQKKADEWLKTDMSKYLRPETLFGTKFESYLNQPKTQTEGERLSEIYQIFPKAE